jgi:N-acetylglutamate synthase-like GNAT family acetyltransferase
MRHARDEDLDRIEPLLAAIRLRTGLIERKRGVFYRRGKAFLHFHAHDGELWADIRAAAGFDRLKVDDTNPTTLLMELDRRLAS